ncbi:antibiotic biosynthesis monooxygenase-like protein [Mytilinidion resinicola]|uniref:Antibiotic biosynthesis monooxygenase-like protein n=1 Tax=Mytilinidion resinicola TaxID=574789 RepID=A0A6A6YNC9_9PEZI|nr:antibiotic biosynthesis monooxygenase-like protein [Mytilinidion resinicola]KAF2810048.1 antibiotic biosynthesis monooxygenase-like protein [Mytilinidion resinicola]
MSDTVSVIAFITPAPGKKEQAQAGLEDLAAKVKENEPGALQYEFYWDEKNGQFVFIEKYKNLDAVAAHRGQVYYSELKTRAEAEGLLAAPIDARVIVHAGGFTR